MSVARGGHWAGQVGTGTPSLSVTPCEIALCTLSKLSEMMPPATALEAELLLL